MALLTWISLLFLVLAVAGSVTVAALGALRAWRSVKRFGGRATAALDEVLRTAAEAERHATALGAGAERLSTATGQLQRSLAQLAVIRSAVNDARAPLRSFRGAVPRK